MRANFGLSGKRNSNRQKFARSPRSCRNVSIKPYEGKFIVDLAGKRHFFETRPNVLYRQDQAGAEPHEQFYQFIV